MTLIFIKIVLTSLSVLLYKISSANIANLSYAGESFQGEISRGGREFSMVGELDFPKLFKNRSVIK